jgi:hypothetical protein
MPYVYQADVWCDSCGECIKAELAQAGQAPEDPEDESSFDSDEYPKHYDSENEESDTPENCADGNCAGGYGTFLRSQLTAEGYKYLKNMLDGHGATLPDYAREWADFYQFSYFEQPYSHASEWLDGHINDLAKGTNGPQAAELATLARDLARKLDGDQIQDLFQSNMDSDDFFKESGWSSPEMGD